MLSANSTSDVFCSFRTFPIKSSIIYKQNATIFQSQCSRWTFTLFKTDKVGLIHAPIGQIILTKQQFSMLYLIFMLILLVITH